MVEHIQITTEDGTFDALAAGPPDGRPVLLLHGFPEAALQWTAQLQVLGQAGCRAVAPDQRGYSPGVRPQHVADYTLDALVDDALAIADASGWDRFDLVGHDWGAAVGWATAARAPKRVRTLVALSVPHPAALNAAMHSDEDQHQRSAYMQALQSSTAAKTLLADGAKALRSVYDHKVPPSHVEEYVGRLSEPGAMDAALNWYRAMRYSAKVDPVEVPVLYAWSTEDVAIGSTAAEGAAKYVTGPYRFEMLPDLSHWLPEEAPEAVTTLILEQLVAHQD